jgi:acyl carrier protein
VAERPLDDRCDKQCAAAVGEGLETFVRTAFAIDPSDGLFSREVDLFDAGYVDSVGLTEVLAFIVEAYGVDIPDEQLLSEEFACIDGMATVICRLR